MIPVYGFLQGDVIGLLILTYEDETIESVIEKIKTAGKDYAKGDKISFDKVLLVDDGKDTTIGTPYITGAKVDAEIIEIGRARKVLVLKYKQKSRYLKRNGHRQPFFKVKITSIK